MSTIHSTRANTARFQRRLRGRSVSLNVPVHAHPNRFTAFDEDFDEDDEDYRDDYRLHSRPDFDDETALAAAAVVAARAMVLGATDDDSNSTGGSNSSGERYSVTGDWDCRGVPAPNAVTPLPPHMPMYNPPTATTTIPTSTIPAISTTTTTTTTASQMNGNLMPHLPAVFTAAAPPNMVVPVPLTTTGDIPASARVGMLLEAASMMSMPSSPVHEHGVDDKEVYASLNGHRQVGLHRSTGKQTDACGQKRIRRRTALRMVQLSPPPTKKKAVVTTSMRAAVAPRACPLILCYDCVDTSSINISELS